MAVTFSTGPGGELLCAFIEGLEEAVEAIFTPELLGEEQYLDEEISTSLARCPGIDFFLYQVKSMLTVGSADISCEEAMSYIGG